MINHSRTLELFNIETSNLAVSSNHLVIWNCERCGKESENAYAYVLKKVSKAKTSGKPCVCQKCSHSHRLGMKNIVYRVSQAVKLPPEILIQETIERFGYDPRKISPWSRQRILVRCSVTGEICSPKRKRERLLRSSTISIGFDNHGIGEVA